MFRRIAGGWTVTVGSAGALRDGYAGRVPPGV
jgi:hypothetical protein